MKISAILDAAADRIAPAGAWAQGAEAYDRDGHITDPKGVYACKWCWKGAIMASDPDYVINPIVAINFANDNLSAWLIRRNDNRFPLGIDVSGFNDSRFTTQEMVVAASRDLAAMARSVGR